MAERDRFPAAYEWRRLMNRMSDEQCGQFWRAIYAWQIDGEEYAGDDPVVGISFEFALPFMRNCRQQYEAVCERNRTNGKKGGRPRKEQAAENPLGFLGYENTGMKNPEGTQTKPRKPDIGIDSDIDIDIDIDSDDDNEKGNGTVPKPDKQLPQPSLLNPALREIIRHYERMISPDMSAATISQLKAAADEWPAEVVISAIDAAVDSGKRNGSYVCGVLRGYRAKHIRTMEDVNRERERHRAEMDDYARQKAARAGRTAGMLPTDDLAQCFKDGKPVFRDAVDEYLESMQEQTDEQKVITAHFPPFKGVL